MSLFDDLKKVLALAQNRKRAYSNALTRLGDIRIKAQYIVTKDNRVRVFVEDRKAIVAIWSSDNEKLQIGPKLHLVEIEPMETLTDYVDTRENLRKVRM